MHVFLIGGTGALGAHLLPRLRERGHTVTGLTRSPEGAALMERHGAAPLHGDIFDPDALREGCRTADGIIDCSTADPRAPRPGGRDWSVNDRIRSEGTRNLVSAAVHRGIGRYVHCGLGLVYGDHGDRWVDEAAGLLTPSLLVPAQEGERAVQEARVEGGLPAVVLRLGTLYGRGLPATEHLLEALRKRLLPLSGNIGAYTSFLSLDDAADATVLALEAGALPPPALNVCDDAPATVERWLPWLARALGAPAPLRLPGWLAALLEDRTEREQRQISLRMTNRLARATLGFRPRFSEYQAGFRQVLAEQGAG